LENCKALLDILKRLYPDTPSGDEIWPSCSDDDGPMGSRRIILFDLILGRIIIVIED
jgi:hypothetical protein